MIVISQALVRSPVTEEPLNRPVAGSHNIVTASNLTANKEDPDHPATELANPSTYLFWRGADTSEQYLTVETGGVDPIDYVAFARHNFGSAIVKVTIEGQTEDGGSWSTLVEEVILPGDGPAMFRFTPKSLVAVRAKLGTGSAPPEAGVMYAGKLLVFQRGLQGGHVPLSLGRRTNTTHGRSETGNYLGTIVASTWAESSASFTGFDKAWARESLEPFLDAIVGAPFFFAWWPSEYPRDTGFAWLRKDPRPSFDANGYVSVTLEMEGVT